MFGINVRRQIPCSAAFPPATRLLIKLINLKTIYILDARGYYYTLSKEVIDPVMDKLGRLTDNSPGLQDLDFRLGVDFFCLLSLDGGTGSALLSTDYGKKSKPELCVLHLSCVVELSRYNPHNTPIVYSS